MITVFCFNFLDVFLYKKASKNSEKTSLEADFGSKTRPGGLQGDFQEIGVQKSVYFGTNTFSRGVLWEPFWHQNFIKILPKNR